MPSLGCTSRQRPPSTEYSAFRFSFYFLGEYINMIIVSLFASTLFLGGVDGPGAEDYWGLGILYLLLKTVLFLFFYIWLRATLPRFRYDQLMGIAWKVLLPLVLVNILITALIRLVANDEIEIPLCETPAPVSVIWLGSNLGQGAFVIGNISASHGGTQTFWGAQAFDG